MTGWSRSDRRSRLPADWTRRRARILARDPICRCRGCELHRIPCLRPSTDVDHVRPGDDHGDDNLQGLCGPCHLRKTVRERPASNRRRPAERHPGLRDPKD